MSYARVPVLVARKNYGMGATPLNERVSMGAVARRRARPLREPTLGDIFDAWEYPEAPPGPSGGQVFNTDQGVFSNNKPSPPGGPASPAGPSVWDSLARAAGGIFGGGAAMVPQQPSTLSTLVPILAIGGVALILLTRKKS